MAATLQILTELGQLDLANGAEESFYITRQIHDLHDFQTKNADFTKMLKIPATPNNLAILDSYTTASTSINAVVPCKIIMEGITVAPDAFLLFFRSTVSNEEVGYDVSIFYGNFNLFNSIKVGTIDEIVWTDLAYDMADAIWITNTGSQNTTDLCTPICDWMGRASGAIMDGDGATPSLEIELNVMGFFMYVKEIIKRIIEEAGFTLVYGSSVPDDYFVLALACPVTKRFEIESTDQISFSNSVTTDPDVNVATNATVKVTFGTIENNSSGWWSEINNEWLVDEAGVVTAELTGIYTHTQIGARPDSEIRIIHNAAIVAYIAIDGDQTDVDYFLIAELSVLAGDVIYAEIFSAVTQTVLTLPARGSTFKVSTAGVDVSSIVQPSQHMPQIGKSDFIANILKMFNLVLQTDDISKVVTIQPFDDVFTGEEQDLSDLLDAGFNEIVVENSIESLGQISWFKWQEDNLLRRDANYSLEFESQVLEKEVTTIEMELSACDNSLLYFDTNADTALKAKIPSAEVSEDAVSSVLITFQTDGSFVLDGSANFNVGDYFGISATASPDSSIWWYSRVIEKDSDISGVIMSPVDPTQLNTPTPLLYTKKVSAGNPVPRLAIIGVDGGEATYTAVNGTTFGSAPNTYRDAYKDGLSQTATWPDRLRWQELTPAYYGKILSALQAPEVIKAWFNVPTALFVQLDFMRPIYIGKFNAFYYLNKINQFKPNNKVQLELIRISSFE